MYYILITSNGFMHNANTFIIVVDELECLERDGNRMLKRKCGKNRDVFLKSSPSQMAVHGLLNSAEIDEAEYLARFKCT
jgi:hypothetical protein